MQNFLKFVFIFIKFVQAIQLGDNFVGVETKKCIIPISSKHDYLAQWPLVFKPSGDLYPTLVDDETSELKIFINDEEDILLSCGPNYLKQFGRQEVINVRCNGDTGNFMVNQSDITSRELTCDLRVIEEVIDSVSGCNGDTSRFGFVDPIKKTSFVLGEACYDVKSGVTTFTHFKLDDSIFNHLEERPNNYFSTLKHPDNRYKIELFRGLNFDEIYERFRLSLLTNKIPQLKISHYIDDSLLGNEQYQAIKKLGWNYFVGYNNDENLKALKSDIRKLSKSKNLDIFVGSHGVKEFHGDNGSQMKLYLHESPKRFPMPDLIWYVIISGSKAVSISIKNYADNNSEIERFSEDTKNLCKISICDKISWLSSELKHDPKIICCDVNEFRQIVREMHTILIDRNMLLLN